MQELVGLVDVCHGLLQCVAIQLGVDLVHNGADVETHQLALRDVRDDDCYVEKVKEDEAKEIEDDEAVTKSLLRV